jgi:ArsR family transcriptional regulator
LLRGALASRPSRRRALPSPARIRSTIATLTDPPADLRAAAIVHKAMADPTRLRILQRLTVGDCTVTDLMRHVDLSQPLVSWHLRRLRIAGLVETRRSGREVVCSLARESLRDFHEQEHELLDIEGRS